MKNIIKHLLKEELTYSLIESLIDEDYPSNFNSEEFKKLKSFNQRVNYCNNNLTRISSGSSRIVYKIDEEKVLKLAKNKKGLAQNEIEISYGNYYDLNDIVAKVFDSDSNNLWVEMELAKRVNANIFKNIVGFSFDDFTKAVYNYGLSLKNTSHSEMSIDKNLVAKMWENEFIYSIFNYIGDYDVPTGDLTRLNSYGLVKRGGEDTIVLIDYGLTSNNYEQYYS